MLLSGETAEYKLFCIVRVGEKVICGVIPSFTFCNDEVLSIHSVFIAWARERRVNLPRYLDDGRECGVHSVHLCWSPRGSNDCVSLLRTGLVLEPCLCRSMTTVFSAFICMLDSFGREKFGRQYFTARYSILLAVRLCPPSWGRPLEVTAPSLRLKRPTKLSEVAEGWRLVWGCSGVCWRPTTLVYLWGLGWWRQILFKFLRCQDGWS